MEILARFLHWRDAYVMLARSKIKYAISLENIPSSGLIYTSRSGWWFKKQNKTKKLINL